MLGMTVGVGLMLLLIILVGFNDYGPLPNDDPSVQLNPYREAFFAQDTAIKVMQRTITDLRADVEVLKDKVYELEE